MPSKRFETPENPSAEDRERMEQLAHDAEGILFAGDITQKISLEAEGEVEPEHIKEQGERILRGKAKEDIEFAEVEFDALFTGRASANEIFKKFERESGWTESKWRAMVGVLRHALSELYYRTRFHAPDERNPHPGGDTRDTKERLITIISDDYGAETMREAEPLVRLYIERAHAFVKDVKRDGEGEDEGEESGDEMVN